MNKNKKVSTKFKIKYKLIAPSKFSSYKLKHSQNGSFSIGIKKINNLPRPSYKKTKKDIENENKTNETKSSLRNEYKKYRIRKIVSLSFRGIKKKVNLLFF